MSASSSLVDFQLLQGRLLKVGVRGISVSTKLDLSDPSKTVAKIFNLFRKTDVKLTSEERREILNRVNTLLEEELKRREAEDFSISQFSQFLNVYRQGGEKNFAEPKGAMREAIQFTFVRPVFEKLKPPVLNGNELIALEKEFTLWELKKSSASPPIYAVDTDGYINQNRTKLALENITDPSIVKKIPKDIRRRIIRNLQMWDPSLELEEEEDIPPEALKPLIYTPVPLLRDPSFLKEEKPIKLSDESLSWKEYVEKLVEWKKGKDPRLKLVHKSKLLRNPYMKYNPHSLEITPSGVGKSLFYIFAGFCIEKATPKAVLGFAKSPEEIYPGTANDSELPIAFDQLESQTSAQLARYCFNLFEYGVSNVDSGAVRFEIRTKSSFAYLGNPKTNKSDLTWLFIHLSTNPALGRRFAWILFETSEERMKPITEKLTHSEEEEWHDSFKLLRAVEEYCQPKIKSIWSMKVITDWINKPIEGYREAIKALVENTNDRTLKSFLLSHAEAQHRVRAAALQIALVENLDKIALGSITPEELIEDAEDILPQIVESNLNSCKVMVEAWGMLFMETVEAWFRSLPEYLKHIISAIFHFIKKYPEKSSFTLNEIPYTADGVEYFSKPIDRLKRSERGLALLEYLRQFGINIKKDNGEFIVTKTDGRSLPTLPLLGRLRSEDENPPKNDSPKNDPPPEKKFPEGGSVNVEKLRKLRNGENTIRTPSDILETFLNLRNDPSPEKGPDRDPKPQNHPPEDNGGEEGSQDQSKDKPKHEVVRIDEPFRSTCTYCFKPAMIGGYVDGRQACMDCINKALRGEK